ncbi:MAG TPA: chemotaxis protein CheW, partial [Thermoguttaceae bacterium]|nr:chemotaxis protein CheW [Thermoguttaceae bacterium]
PTTSITHLPKAHPSIRGVFKLRDQVIPCVSLLDYLGIEAVGERSESTMILTDLNQQQTAFLVDEVERIHRLSWQNILAVPNLEALSHTPVTALARCEDRLVVMLDFEMILDEITSQYFRTDAVENPLGLPRETLKILLAEDSPTVREAIGATLRKSGYVQLEFFENGMEAWKWFEQRLAESEQVEAFADLLICDVEMPQMDGFHLTKRIKDHPQLRTLPVLLYSSIITPDNRKKGQAVGADAQVSKPQLREVVRLADELIAKAKQEHRSTQWQQVAALSKELSREMGLPAESDPSPLEKKESAGSLTTGLADAAEQLPDGQAVSQTAVSCPRTTPTASQQESTAPCKPTCEATAVQVSPSETASAPGPNSLTVCAPSTPANEPISQTTPEVVSPNVPSSENQELIKQKLREEEQNSGAKVLKVLSGEIPPPRGVDAKLWKVFTGELGDLAEQLRRLLDQVESGPPSDEVITETLRTLHTMKSAAMVVPVDPVVRLVHLIEGQVIRARDEDRNRWPQARLHWFLEWVQQLLTPGNDPNLILATAARLEQEMAS